MQVYKEKAGLLQRIILTSPLGDNSYTLEQLDNAVSAFRHILINESKQSAAQQGAFLRRISLCLQGEYLFSEVDIKIIFVIIFRKTHF